MTNTSKHLTPAEEDAGKEAASNTSASVPNERASAPEEAEPKLESRPDPSTESLTGPKGTQNPSIESGVMPLNDAEPPSPEKGERDQVAAEGQENYDKVEAKIAVAARECLNSQSNQEKSVVLIVAKLYGAVYELLASPALLDAFSKKYPKVNVGRQSDNPVHGIVKAALGEDRKLASKISRHAKAAWGLHLAHVSATKKAVLAWCGKGGIEKAQKVAAARRKELRAERQGTPVEANDPTAARDDEVPLVGFGPRVAKKRNLTKARLVGLFERKKDGGYGLVKWLDDLQEILGFGPTVAKEHNLTQPQLVALFARSEDGGYRFMKWLDDYERGSGL